MSIHMQSKAAKPMLWISMASMTMIFAGLTSGYVVRRAEGDWMVFALPNVMYLATALLVISSGTMYFALQKFKKGEIQGGKIGLLLTFFLGLGFLFTQLQTWRELVDMGIYFTGEDFNAAGGFLYVLTLVHLCHLVGGLIALAVTFVKASKGKYSADNYLGVELASIFWHFLDVLWIYLFLFLLFIR